MTVDFGFRISDFGFGHARQANQSRCARVQSAFRNPHSAIRAAFSFTEIMFAVMILGIGFIMVAAIFPVALQQSKSTTEEITAAPIARGASNFVSQLITDNMNPTVTPQFSNVPATGTLSTITQFPMVTGGGLSPLWDTVRGNLVLPSDPRYGFICLYSRLGTPPAAPATPTPATDWKSYIQLYIFPVQSRATPTFTQVDATIPYAVPPLGFDEKNNYVPNLMARRVQVAIVDSNSNPALVGQPDFIALDLSAVGKLSENTAAAVEGAYVVIVNDKLVDTPAGTAGRMNGRIFRLGARRTDMDSQGGLFGNPGLSNNMLAYELQPGGDLTRDGGFNGMLWNATSNSSDNDDIVAIGNTTPIGGSNSNVKSSATADAYLIGKSYSDPANPAGGYEGTAMPVGAYVTFLQVK